MPDDTPPQSDHLATFAALAQWVRTIYPNARRLRLHFDVPTGDGGDWMTAELPIPDTPSPGELEGRILATLANLKPGAWMKGASLAFEVDEDRGSGTFQRACRKLRDAEQIESHPQNGYRLASPRAKG